MQRTKSSWCRLPFAFFGCAVKSKRHKNLLLHEFLEASIFAKSEKLRRRISSHLFWQIVDQSYEQSRKLGTETLIFCRLCFIYFTHPLKKGLDKKIYAWLLTLVSIIIYQAEHNLWCPENVGWGNFAQLQKFQVKYGKNGQKRAKNGWNIFFGHHI